MPEADVQAVFVRHLLERGWDVLPDVAGGVDVDARRGTERLLAEVKGRTSEPGLDVDTAYGQLLRRMDDPDARYVLVVPEALVAKVLRVPARVRAALSIEVAAVDDMARVRWV